MVNKILASPLLARVVPFTIFACLPLLQACFGESSQYWPYALKTVLSTWMLWVLRPYVKGMRWNFSGNAILAGVKFIERRRRDAAKPRA